MKQAMSSYQSYIYNNIAIIPIWTKMSLRRLCKIMADLLLIVHKLPVQPGAQIHVNDPIVFTQVAP